MTSRRPVSLMACLIAASTEAWLATSISTARRGVGTDPPGHVWEGRVRISEAERYDHPPPDRDEDGRGCAGLARAARRRAAADRTVGRPSRRRQRGRTPT